MSSNTKKKKISRKLISGIAIVILLLAAAAAGILYLKIYEPGKRSADLGRLQQEAYQGVFCSMYAPEAFPEDIYSAYMGYDAVSCSHRLTSFSDISAYLETAFSSGNEITHVLLILDPLLLWNSNFHNNSRFYTSFDENLLAYVDAYSGVEFTILFSCPSLEYWQTHSRSIETYENLVRVLTAPLSARENVSLFFPGGEEWLISNPDAYDTPLELNAAAARSVMLLVLSGTLQYHGTDSGDMSLSQFDTLVQTAIAAPASYSDLSGYDIVFFGDSVFGNYQDFASIPGVISALTKADTHNLAIGGSSATQISTDDNSFPSVVQSFLADDAVLSGDKKLCFVINYGLNDYFSGYTTAEYRDSLQAGMQFLQNAYPDAEIVIVSPNFITAFDNGTAFNNDLEEILNDYVTVAEETAAAMNVPFFNSNEVLQWNVQNAACYLVDAVHPNEEGRFLFGTAIIKALEEFLP